MHASHARVTGGAVTLKIICLFLQALRCHQPPNECARQETLARTTETEIRSKYEKSAKICCFFCPWFNQS